jgi:hypothetical protein
VQPKYIRSIYEKNLTKKSTKNEKIKKARNMKTIIGNCQVVKGIKEKSFQFHHYPFRVFKTSIITSSPDASHEEG